MMKKYIYIGGAALIVILVLALIIALKSRSGMERKWKEATENVKAYSEQYNSSESSNRAFKLTIEQLKTSEDSIFQELDAVRKELRIKDSRLQSIQYVASSFSKTDTITLRDTIFKDATISMDTTLSDEWYSVRVGLVYPSTIAVKPEFKSVKNIAVSTRKETVNPPKKFFLLRWLQKKQTVLNVDVVEKNPYVENQSDRYVEIIR